MTMDDLTTLRDAWHRPEPPSPTAHAAARAALLDRAAARDAAPKPRRLPRPGVRLMAVGALAATVAAGVAVAQHVGGVDENRSPGHGPPVAPVATVQTVLDTAAERAGTRPFTAPRAGQWVYTETRYRAPRKPASGDVQTARTPLRTRVDRIWTRADGLRTASYDNGKLVISPTGGAMPPQDYATVATLPRDPGALLTWISRNGLPGRTEERRRDNAFSMLASVLNQNGVIPPAQEAAIYRAMARIPGVTLDRTAVDAAGHPALAVSLVENGVQREDVFLDPATYAFRGGRVVAVRDHRQSTGVGKADWATIEKGAVDVVYVRLAAGIADRPGQHP